MGTFWKRIRDCFKSPPPIPVPKDTIKTGPDLRKIAKDLWNIISGGQCIVWVGAGLSIPAGYPGWSKTLDELCSACGVTHLALDCQSTQQLINKAEECKKANLQAYSDKLADLFGKPVVQARHAYYLLMKIPFRGYVTTNFDPLLAEAAGLEEDCKLFAYPVLPPNELGAMTKPIYYIHGLARQDNTPIGRNLVLARSDFDEAYNGTVTYLINPIFLYNSILFIGCNLTEPEIEESFRRVHDIHEDIKRKIPSFSPKPRYALLPHRKRVSLVAGGYSKPEPDYEAERDEEKRFNSLAIEIIRYDPSDKLHREIEQVLNFLLEFAVRPPSISPSEGLPL